MGDQIDKLKTNMGVKAVVLRQDDHDQEMKGVYNSILTTINYKILLFLYIIHMYRPLAFLRFLAGKSL